MCHSPSGAFRVQAPVRAPWAVADAATATLSPAAIPPDTTFCVKRFITDLRMKGGSTALLHSVATCCLSHAASAGTAEAATGLECRSWGTGRRDLQAGRTAGVQTAGRVRPPLGPRARCG